MSKMCIRYIISAKRMDAPGLLYCPVWSRKFNVLSRFYNEKKSCYLKNGEAFVTPFDGAAV